MVLFLYSFSINYCSWFIVILRIVIDGMERVVGLEFEGYWWENKSFIVSIFMFGNSGGDIEVLVRFRFGG